MTSERMTDVLFISAGMHYYVAGRYAVFAGLNPTAANLLHHAVEMVGRRRKQQRVTISICVSDRLGAQFEVYKRQQRRRRIECGPCQCRHVTATVLDDAAARLRGQA